MMKASSDNEYFNNHLYGTLLILLSFGWAMVFSSTFVFVVVTGITLDKQAIRNKLNGSGIFLTGRLIPISNPHTDGLVYLL